MRKEIGSFLELDLVQEEAPSNGTSVLSWLDSFVEPGRHLSLFQSGRSAIYAIIEDCEKRGIKKSVLIPAYMCDSVRRPFIEKGFHVIDYSLDAHFSPDIEYLWHVLQNREVGVLFLHPYYGKDGCRESREELLSNRDRYGYVVAEDVTQSLLAAERSGADYVFGSLRKWFPIPDGGFLFAGSSFQSPKDHSGYYELQYTAMVAKARYLSNGEGEKESYLRDHSHAEDMLDEVTDHYQISDYSKERLEGFNLESRMRKRWENANTLVRVLRENERIDVGELYAEREVPLYVPIWVRDRKALQDCLNAEEIYLSILWKPADEERFRNMSEDDRRHYSDMLAIPCDERYDDCDMKHIAKRILYHMKGTRV